MKKIVILLVLIYININVYGAFDVSYDEISNGLGFISLKVEKRVDGSISYYGTVGDSVENTITLEIIGDEKSPSKSTLSFLFFENNTAQKKVVLSYLYVWLSNITNSKNSADELLDIFLKTFEGASNPNNFSTIKANESYSLKINNTNHFVQVTITEEKNKLPGLVLIPAGNFEMGSIDGYTIESPVHTVLLTYDFYMGKYEVTNKEFLEFLNATKGIDSDGYMNSMPYINLNSYRCDFVYNDGRFKLKENEKANYPVIEVTWFGAVAYCNWLSRKNNLPEAYEMFKDGWLTTYKLKDYPKNIGFRLPTEAEWEYAAKGGEDYKYSGSNNLDIVGWYDSNSDERAHKVGQKKANGYELFDMSGNVDEWTSTNFYDDYQDDYPKHPEVNPYYTQPGNDGSFPQQRITRGGYFFDAAFACRVSSRGWYMVDSSYPTLGFRITRTNMIDNFSMED